MELLLHFSPTIHICEFAGARLEQILRRHRVLVAFIPLVDQPLIGVSGSIANLLELHSLDPRRQRAPAVALPEQHDEVGLDAGLLAALNLAQADIHGLLVERRLVAHTPAQVDGLEARAVRFAELAQAWEDLALQGVALGLQVFKGRTDKYPECACCGWHGACSSKPSRALLAC